MISTVRLLSQLRVSFLAIGLLIIAAGCTTTRNPHTPLTVLPELASNHFTVGDGVQLPIRVWRGEDTPYAVIVAVHGFNDYRRAFDLPGAYLAAHGVHVYAYDQRGFGETASRGIWPGVKTLQGDLLSLVGLLKQRYPGTPVYLLGDSMGGAVVSLAATAAPTEIQGIILNAPAVWGQQTFNPFYRIGLWLLAHTLPSMEVTGKGIKITVSDNIPLLRELSQDALMIRETRIDALYGLVGLMDNALEQAPRIKLPTLLLYGLKDEVIPLQSICAFSSKLNSAQIAFYEQGYHFLLRDLSAEYVWGDILRWLRGDVAFDRDVANKVCDV